MKQYLLAVILFFTIGLQAAVGCMDNSYHANPCVAYDYKNYHPVKCSCRCSRYAHSLNRGMCRRCGHYRVPEETFKISWPQKNQKSVARKSVCRNQCS